VGINIASLAAFIYLLVVKSRITVDMKGKNETGDEL